MAKRQIGFTPEPPEPEFTEASFPLVHYRTYGSTVQYQVVIEGDWKEKASVYLPKFMFPEGANFPDRIQITVSVPDGTKWTVPKS